MGLSTGFKKVAQSGKTIDGREIKPQMLLDAASTYDTTIYTALVFPDHNVTDQSYGVVNALKAETDKNGVVSLFADIQPNVFWQSDIRYGQNMFTSVALQPNFAGSGKWYMQHLAATNNPASLGIEKLEFTRTEPAALFSAAFDTKESLMATEEEQAMSFFRKLFTTSKPQGELTMSDKETMRELQATVATIQQKISTFVEKKTDNEDEQAVKLTALGQENAELKAKVQAFEASEAKRTEEFNALKTQIETLSKTLADALKEQPSVKPQNFGSEGNPQNNSIYA